MQVPFFSLAKQSAQLKPLVLHALSQVFENQEYANGPAVAAFERELASYLGIKEVVAVNSGTSALHAALLAVGVGPGDEVLTVPFTWISTAWAISYLAATPVFVDIDPQTCGMSAKDLARRITKKTKAILPVHLFGHPVEMDPILELGDRHGIPIVEDCAQSMGARYRGRPTGTLGRISATSFYPSKNLGACGEGGAVMTDDTALAARVRRLRDHAQAQRHHHVELGYNWRMDGFQGAVLSVKLPYLDEWNARRQSLALRYRRALEGIAELELLPEHTWAEPVWHIFPVFHPRRDAVRAALLEHGIQTGIHYPTPVHRQPAYARLGLIAGTLPCAERAALCELSLPMFPELGEAAVDYVAMTLRKICGETRQSR